MLPFATEFPVKKTSHSSEFLAEVVAWLRGNNFSTVLNETAAKELDGENAQFLADNGEHLQLRELKISDTWKAIGFRHDLPDDLGRLWRTEGVLTRSENEDCSDIVRIRTQCIANIPTAPLQTPKKPYLIKSLLKGNWGGSDHCFSISDRPFFLKDDATGEKLAAEIINGNASTWLPIVYISTISHGEWPLNLREINSLAYQLGGIAHVALEPSRLFSLRLRELCDGKNPFGGAISIVLPNQGAVFQRVLRKNGLNTQDLLNIVVTAASTLRSQMPSMGWDWTELQEKYLREFRNTYRGSLTAEDADKLLEDYVTQLSDVQEENRLLKERISTDSVANNTAKDSAQIDNISNKIGSEIYQGEISDRLRLAAKLALERADASGLDDRSRAIFERIVEHTPRSTELDALLLDLSRAVKDPKKACRELTYLLNQHGYISKSENKHVRMEPLDGYFGLGALTLPKTPSDYRGLINLQKQIERTLGLGSLL